MVRVDEHTNFILQCLHEGGIDFNNACDLLELRKTYTRTSARDLITSFINKFCKTEDNKHPLLNLHPLQTRELIELLQQDSSGVKANLFPDEPSVW
jgi:hypothetical protein